MAAQDGHDVVLVTALGDDPAGRRLEGLLDGVRLVRLPYDGPTPVKQRVRAGGQPLLRLDTGSRPGIFHGLPPSVATVLTGAAAVLVADYGRGVTGLGDLRELLRALPRRVPVTWDPHPRGAEPVAGARLVTPNRSEARLFADRLGVPVPEDGGRLAQVGSCADGVGARWHAGAGVVTLGGGGGPLSDGGGAPGGGPGPGGGR